MAHLCLMGDIQRVASGEAMLEQALARPDRIIDRESKTFLAPFALAGDSGADLCSVADLLNTSIPQIKSVLASLAAGGIVRGRPNRQNPDGPAYVSVEPPEMRWVLVRDEFFGGAVSLPYHQMLSVAENKNDAYMTLIGAKSRGAVVPGLLDHLEEAQAPHLWSAYGKTGPVEIRQVLERHPELILECAEAALLYMPDDSVPRLLDYVDGRSSSADLRFDRAMDEIARWGVRLDPTLDSEESVNRRRSLVRGTKKWWERTSEDTKAVRVMCMGLSPHIDFASLDPGAGTRVNVMHGIYSLPMLEGLAELWPDLLDVIAASKETPWNDLLSMISSWRYGDPVIDLPDDTESFMGQFADKMLLDLVEVTRERPGVQHRLRSEIQKSGVAAHLHLDSDFELAHPDRQTFSMDENKRLAEALASALSERSAEELAGSLARVEREALFAGFGGRNVILGTACEILANRVAAPLDMVEALLMNRISVEVVEPFLAKAAAQEASRWASWLDSLLGDDKYKEMAVGIIVSHPAPPDGLLSVAMSKVPETPGIVRDWCARGRVANQTLEALLCHWDDVVAVSAAVGHWSADPRGTVSDQHTESWRNAVLRPVEYPDRDWGLGEILLSDGELATEWLVSVLQRDTSPGLGLQWAETLSKAVQAMNSQQRRRVLETLPTGPTYSWHLVAELVTQGNLDMYGELLCRQDLKGYHLSPLPGHPDLSWQAMAKLACEAGYSVEEIAAATVSYPRSWRGSESEMWGRVRSAFEVLFDRDVPIGAIARIAADIITERENYAKAIEEDEAVRGW